MTLIASTKNATKTPINVDWIPTALIGLSAARIHHVLMGRAIVIKTQNVKVYLSVALTTVLMEQIFWIVAARKYTKVKDIQD